MRFIIHEMGYETPLAAGKLRYMRDGQPTGAVESWRLTAAVEGYRFLRVDLDARAAESGHTYLYHATLNGNGRIEQLKYQFWDNQIKIVGNVVFEKDAVVGTRDVNNQRFEDVLEMPVGYQFWFPATQGLGLLTGAGEGTAVTLNTQFTEPSNAFQLKQWPVKVEQMETAVHITWDDQMRTLSLNEQGHIMKMERGDGLTAVETQLIEYAK